MAEKKAKKLVDLKTFIESINNKNEKRHGLRVRFDFVKKKRKN